MHKKSDIDGRPIAAHPIAEDPTPLLVRTDQHQIGNRLEKGLEQDRVREATGVGIDKRDKQQQISRHPHYLHSFTFILQLSYSHSSIGKGPLSLTPMPLLFSGIRATNDNSSTLFWKAMIIEACTKTTSKIFSA